MNSKKRIFFILKEENPEDKLYPDLVEIRKNFRNQSVWRIGSGMEELVSCLLIIQYSNSPEFNTESKLGINSINESN